MIPSHNQRVRDLEEAAHKGRVVVSWSVNSDHIVGLFEHRVTSVDKRIAATRKVQEAGYEVRFRIDPIFTYDGWKSGYEVLVKKIFDNVTPSMITLGEYGVDKKLIWHIEIRFPESRLIELDKQLKPEAGKKRYDPHTRINLYSHIIRAIRRRDRKVTIALCKETVKVWEACRLDHRDMSCNCTNLG